MLKQYFSEYLRRYRPFKPYWNYEDGCVLLGCQRLYEATGAQEYAQFVLDYLSERVAPDGSIPTYPTERHSMDSFNCGKALFFALELTGEERFRRAIDWHAAQLSAHPRTKSGICWHKQIYPEQVWIDGVYMAAPFFAAYAGLTGKDCIFTEIGRWFAYLREKLRHPQTGLYAHAMDEAKVQPWADPETGLSRSYWLRGTGWLLMALADTAALLPDTQASLRAELSAQLCAAADALLPCRTAGGLLCQVIDCPELPGNYTETSGNLMTAYALMRGAALGCFPDAASYAQTGSTMLRTILREKLISAEDGLHLTDICSSAGLGTGRDGSAAYYLSEPVVRDDPKGVGALMMAAAFDAAERMDPVLI